VGQTVGRYKLLEKVGEGGCGVVYVAEQLEPVRRRVALKVIKLGMDTKAVVARFEAERQALAMMDHPNIAKVLDAGTTETGRPYFVMELVRGIRITDYCDQANLSARERLDLFIQVCHAIQHAHQKGIIHRDIKPSNILVTLHDGVPVPKVIDFGIAKATEGRLTDATVYTQLHQFIGTPAYMSPEQAEMSGLDIDTRSDIYSLGVLLYELLAGSTPFDPQELMAAGIDAMRKTIREKEPMRPSTRLATLKVEDLTTAAKRRSCEAPKLIHLVKGDLDWIVMKCLEKDRMRRYETANGLAADLKRHLDNEPVVARPPSATYRLQKAFRRNKMAFSAGVAVVLALVAGLTLAAIGWRQTRVERDKALHAQAGEEMQRKAAQASAVTAQEQTKRAETREAEARRLLYVANMNLAQEAWEQNHVGRLRELLVETQAFPERGFEWYYWQHQTHIALLTLKGHTNATSSVAFSPDGRRIVTGGGDNTAKVWDAATGKELVTLRGHTNWVIYAAFSPDGQRVFTGSSEAAKVWDAATGNELDTFDAHTNSRSWLATSPDGRRILTGAVDVVTGAVDTAHRIVTRAWDAASGRELLNLKGSSGWLPCVAFSPDGQRIVTGKLDEARLLDAASGRQLLTLKTKAASVAFSPDGLRIVTGGFGGEVTVWDASSGKELLPLTSLASQVWSVAFSPDGHRIVAGGEDQTVMVWDADTGRELFAFKGHSSAITSVAFSPDGQRIVTGSSDGTSMVWDAVGGKGPAGVEQESKSFMAKLWKEFHDQGLAQVDERTQINMATFSMVFSLDGRRILTRDAGGTVKLWDAASGQELLALEVNAMCVALSPDGQRIVTGDLRRAKVWDAANSRELASHKGMAASVAFSPEGQRIISRGNLFGAATVWDAATGRDLFTLDVNAASIAFSPDGQRIVTGSGSFDGIAKVWDAATGRELFTLKGLNPSVAFSPDSRRIVTAGSDGSARVWDAADGRELLTLKGHHGRASAAAFSPDGRRIVTGSLDQSAKVWEASSGRELLTLKGHKADVSFVAFSPDGRRIVTGSFDKTAKLWDASTGRELLTLKGHRDFVGFVALSPNGQWMVTGTSGNFAQKVWEAARPDQVARWQAEEAAAQR
jgi:WD40 repeat protein/tRNA A-37 threonylcarbamoyl transferase component Bud32